MSAPYTDAIRHWATDTRRAGVLADADGTGEVGLGEGEAGRRLAVRFALRVRDGRAETVRYQVFGCGFTIAACAAAAELAEGRPLHEIATIASARIDATLAGLPAERIYCAELAVAALQAAVESVSNGHRPVQPSILSADSDEHAPRVTAADPVYRLLIDSPAPCGAPPEDRHLFACLLAAAAGESAELAARLGLTDDALRDIVALYFPAVAPADLRTLAAPAPAPPLQTSPALYDLLSTYLPHDGEDRPPAPALWLARIVAARAACPGHLWAALGLRHRGELTAALRRHLPALAAANHQGMRWKRFFFKQLCDCSGGTLCRAPNCGSCSDFEQCFGAE